MPGPGAEPMAPGKDADNESISADTLVRRVPIWVPWLAFALSLLGVGLSSYLTYDHFTGALPVCSDKGFVNCAAVTTSPESYFLGIPVAVMGLAFYVAMTVVNITPLWKVRARWLAWLRILMALSGIGFVFHLLWAELFDVKALCLWCTGVHITTFILFIVVMVTAPAMLAPSYDGDDSEFQDGALEDPDLDFEDA